MKPRHCELVSDERALINTLKMSNSFSKRANKPPAEKWYKLSALPHGVQSGEDDVLAGHVSAIWKINFPPVLPVVGEASGRFMEFIAEDDERHGNFGWND